MSDKLMPYGAVRNANIVAKIGHSKRKYNGRIVGGKNVIKVERHTAITR